MAAQVGAQLSSEGLLLLLALRAAVCPLELLRTMEAHKGAATGTHRGTSVSQRDVNTQANNGCQVELTLS